MKKFELMNTKELIHAGERVDYLIDVAEYNLKCSIGLDAIYWGEKVLELKNSKKKLRQCYDKLNKNI